MKKKSKTGTLVYSTNGGRHCPACRQPLTSCSCAEETPVTSGSVRVRRESKGRAGKVVTVISGLPFVGAQLNALAGDLKKRCGSGGTVKNGMIEIQGEHVTALLEVLKQRGLRVK